MSVSWHPTIICDTPSCGQWYEGPEQSARAARRAARGFGWRYVGRRDVCPPCYWDDGSRTPTEAAA